MSTAIPPSPIPAEVQRDFGLGGRLAELVGGQRILNRDGTYNVRRTGTNPWAAVSLYHTLLTISWTQYFARVAVAYLAANVFFGSMFYLAGLDALEGIRKEPAWARFQDCFFFSVQTIATIGYGRISPVSTVAHVVVTLTALSGLLGFAVVTGIMFARFSRPLAKLVFSDHAVVAPYRGGTGLMFRLANQRTNELSEVTATVILTHWETVDGRRQRKFRPLPLERDKVSFLPWHWVVVHPIDEKSPLWRMDEEAMRRSQPELLILITAMDETFAQTVHTRTSYHGNEILWNARFRSMMDEENALEVDLRRIDDIERL